MCDFVSQEWNARRLLPGLAAGRVQPATSATARVASTCATRGGPATTDGVHPRLLVLSTTAKDVRKDLNGMVSELMEIRIV